jgi:hypothetical protein
MIEALTPWANRTNKGEITDHAYRRLHRITGTMALHWCRVTPVELKQWGREPQAIGGEMQVKANAPCALPDQTSPPDKDDPDIGRETSAATLIQKTFGGVPMH